MPKIQILKNRCQACGRCVDICPEGLFIQVKPGAVPKIPRQRGCIICGHCVSICPQKAVVHVDFPLDEALDEALNEGAMNRGCDA